MNKVPISFAAMQNTWRAFDTNDDVANMFACLTDNRTQEKIVQQILARDATIIAG